MRNYVFIGLLLFLSCRSGDKKLAAIRDFGPSLRPWLVRAAGTGIAGYDTATRFIEAHATDKELMSLSRSEQPLLRAIALETMMNRPSFDHFKVIMDHLDDTAIITMDAGEWGFRQRTVSDFLVESCGKWKTIADRAKTMDAILLHHDYLRAAYSCLWRVELTAAYYPHLRKMAQQDRDYEEIEDALYALAQYRKKEDVSLIKSIILRNLSSRVRERTFRLIRDYPDTAYMTVLGYFFPRRFYRQICINQGDDWGEIYIEAVGCYKNDSSAAILKAMLERKPFVPCRVDTVTLRGAIIHAIWDNPCPAYAELRRETLGWKKYFDYHDTADILRIDNPYDTFKDTVVRPEPVSWYSQ